jgi:hypothetical protein
MQAALLAFDHHQGELIKLKDRKLNKNATNFAISSSLRRAGPYYEYSQWLWCDLKINRETPPTRHMVSRIRLLSHLLAFSA